MLKGSLKDILNGMLQVGSDLEHFISYCAKEGQMIPVGIGAPTIKMCADVFHRG